MNCMVLAPEQPVQCLFRRIVIVVDYSASTVEQTYFANYADYLRRYIPWFVQQVVWNHTLAYCGLVLTYDEAALTFCQLQISSNDFETALLQALSREPSGVQSVSAALRAALSLFPSSTIASSNEILYISASLVTKDVDDIQASFQQIQERGIRCNVISFDCHMHLFSELARVGRGFHYVPLDEAHLQRILRTIALQQSETIINKGLGQHASRIPFGFPIIEDTDPSKRRTMRFCVCHFRIPLRGFDCPGCGARLCDSLPNDCPVCGLLSLPGAFIARVQVERAYELNKASVKEHKKRTPLVISSHDTVNYESKESPEESQKKHDDATEFAKSMGFCPVCDFPYTRQAKNELIYDEDDEQNDFQFEKVHCGGCGLPLCVVCAEYIESFLRIAPCCGAYFQRLTFD